ncbi:MAG: orotate phosphoribosyltransferase [Parcubacteria group bacterium Gr01-1014_29]|nr:MAG: orotate phosphoribosyltransferase [Parcubacteria group bacterium Gr01-1014_29]
MNSSRARQLLAECGAIIEGHFVGTSGKHLSVYVAKDAATKRSWVASELCSGIAERFYEEDIDAVVAPAVGGVALSQWTAHHLSGFCLKEGGRKVLALYAEHEEELIGQCDEGQMYFSYSSEVRQGGFTLTKGQSLVIKKPTFVLKRGFNVDVRGKQVLVVEDILTTGGSAKNTVDAVRTAGGIVMGLGVLANGGGVTAEDVGVEKLEALMNVERRIYTEDGCRQTGMCMEGILINTEFGHGAEFLARK